MAFYWRADDDPLLSVFGSPQQLQTTTKTQSWTPSEKNFLDPHDIHVGPGDTCRLPKYYFAVVMFLRPCGFCILRFFLALSMVGLLSVIVVFPAHTHLF